MYESLLRLPGDILGEFERMQREMEQVVGGVGRPVSIRAVGRGAFPAITIGSRPAAIEISALAPGIDPSKLQVSIDRGLLTIAGERSADVPAETDKVNVYAKERFAGAFKRVISFVNALAKAENKWFGEFEKEFSRWCDPRRSCSVSPLQRKSLRWWLMS